MRLANIIMEAILNSPKTHDGLLQFGFVSNLRNGDYIKDITSVLAGTSSEHTSQDIREIANNATILELNLNGYELNSKGEKIAPSRVFFKAFNTGYKNVGNYIRVVNEFDVTN